MLKTFAPAQDFELSNPGTAVRPPEQEERGAVVYLLGPSGELWHVTQPSG